MCPCVPRGKLCPLLPSILDLPAPSRDCGARSRVPPLLPGPKSSPSCPPGGEQSRGVVLGFLLMFVPGSPLVLQSEQVIPEPPWRFRVDQSHPESNSHLSLSRASPGVSCATQTQLNTALPSFPSVPQVSRGCPVVSLSPVQIYPYELLLVKTRGRNQLPKDVDRTRLEVRRAFFTLAIRAQRGGPGSVWGSWPREEHLHRSTGVSGQCHSAPAAPLAGLSCPLYLWQEQEGGRSFPKGAVLGFVSPHCPSGQGVLSAPLEGAQLWPSLPFVPRGTCPRRNSTRSSG